MTEEETNVRELDAYRRGLVAGYERAYQEMLQMVREEFKSYELAQLVAEKPIWKQ